MHTSLAEATYFANTGIKMQCVLMPIGFVFFFGTRQARKSCMILSLAQRSQLQMAPRVSQPELALVRGWQSEGWAAKEMWKYAQNLCSK